MITFKDNIPGGLAALGRLVTPTLSPLERGEGGGIVGLGR